MKKTSLIIIICLILISLPIYADSYLQRDLFAEDKDFFGSQVFRNIWIANTGEGTITKYDNDTGQELAKYYTGPVSNTEPGYIAVDSKLKISF